MRSFTYMLIVIPKAGFTITKGEDLLKEFTLSVSSTAITGDGAVLLVTLISLSEQVK